MAGMQKYDMTRITDIDTLGYSYIERLGYNKVTLPGHSPIKWAGNMIACLKATYMSPFFLS